jgi:hypothetical protein
MMSGRLRFVKPPSISRSRAIIAPNASLTFTNAGLTKTSPADPNNPVLLKMA